MARFQDRFMRSSNPAARNDVFTRTHAVPGQGVMTLGGTLAKTGLLVTLTIAAALYTWNMVGVQPERLGFLIPVGAIGGFVLALITIFVPKASPVTAPLYAVLEGVALGGVSALFNARYAGLPAQAVAITFGVAAVMLVLYRTGAVRATPMFRRILLLAGLGVMLVYLVNMVMGFFGSGIGMVTDASPLGIGFSAVAAAVAAFFLILDFDQIEGGIAARAPKYMEWYAGFTLLMTLVWLYLEVLRLLSKLNRR
jgi:uncharacterized YccA/Bax inhibitor family protein